MEKRKIELSSLAKFEKNRITESLSRKDQRQFEQLLADTQKQIFLILGEPRTGKTTLAIFATISETTGLVDTDAYHSQELIKKTTASISDFIRAESKKILIITVGKHRQKNYAVEELVGSYASEEVLVSICRMGKAK